MTRKQIIVPLALLLSLACAVALFSGCNGPLFDRTVVNTTVPTTLVPVPDDLGKQIEIDLGRMEERDEMDRLLAEELKKLGIEYTTDPNAPTVPAGQTEPTTAPPPPPTTMPAGTKIQSSEVYEHIKRVNDIFNSGKFYLKGRGSAPEGSGIPSAASAPMVIAIDDNKFMVESTADWSLMGTIMADAEGRSLTLQERAAAKAQSIALETLFGKKTRMIFSPDGFYLAFPDKNKYISPSELMGSMGLEDEEFDMSGMDLSALGINTGAQKEIPRDIDSSRVTVGGKEYLCAAISNKIDDPDSGVSMEVVTKYYFLGGDLKRMETFGLGFEDSDDAQMILEIDEFHGDPDPKLFGVAGMRKAALQELLKLAEMMGGGGLLG